MILNLSPRSECNSHDEKAMPTGTIALNIHNFRGRNSVYNMLAGIMKLTHKFYYQLLLYTPRVVADVVVVTYEINRSPTDNINTFFLLTYFCIRKGMQRSVIGDSWVSSNFGLGWVWHLRE